MISLNKIKQIIEKEDENPTLYYKEDLNLENEGDKATICQGCNQLSKQWGNHTHH